MSSSNAGFGALLAVAAMIQLAGAEAANASVISSTPTLPVLGVPYKPVSGAGCFTFAAVCVDLGNLTMTSPVSSTFNGSGQDIITGATYRGLLTTLAGRPIAPLLLTGTVEEEVLGRASATELGTWATDLLSLSLTGTVKGHTLTVGLDPAHPSTGSATIAPVGGGDQEHFRISSFFDVFVELDLASLPPLHTTRGPIRVSLAPEPASLVLLAPALFGLIAIRLRRR
jgi:hypothetical protein